MTTAVLLVHSHAGAQGLDAEVRIDQLHPSSAGSPFARAEAPHEQFEQGIGYALRLASEYQLAPLQTTIIGDGGDDQQLTPVAHALLGHVGASMSPLYWMNIELNLSFAAFETGQDDARLSQQVVSEGTAGIGDFRAGAHFRPLSSEAFDLSVGARVWAPTGDSDAYMGTNDKFLRFELVPAVAGEVDLLAYGCTLGIGPLFFAGRDGDRLATSCAAHFKLAPMIALGIEPHIALFSYSAASSQTASEHTPGLDQSDVVVQFEPLASAVFTFGNFGAILAGGAGFGSAPGTPKARAMFTLSWTARGERVVGEVVTDSDLDGIRDDYDACPKQAGTKARRGCPDERDVDGDGIVTADACPEQPGAYSDNPDANGCPDRDNDHIADPIDPCPTEPGEATGGCPKFARIHEGDFVITPPIRFAVGKARLSGIGKAALIEVMQTMRANANLKQVSIAIGSKRAHVALTDRRAAAILELFADQNFASSQYEVVLEPGLRAGRVTVHLVK